MKWMGNKFSLVIKLGVVETPSGFQITEMRFKVAVVLRLLSFHCLFLQINPSEQIIITFRPRYSRSA